MTALRPWPLIDCGGVCGTGEEIRCADCNWVKVPFRACLCRTPEGRALQAEIKAFNWRADV